MGSTDRDLPTGTITFVFTDVAGSTDLWERHPGDMGPALEIHERIIDDAVAGNHGQFVRTKGEGDSTFSVFPRASDAISAALEMQRALHRQQWPKTCAIRVRVAVHTGEAELRDGDYYGSAVNRCARLRAIANGGQVLVSKPTLDLARDRLPDGTAVRDLGPHRLKDLLQPENIYQLTHPDLPADFPPLASLDVVVNNLPFQLKSFVPREDEIAQVLKRIDQHRLVTLTGAGGAGKTRLALQAAAEVLESFPDGIWLIDLASLMDPGLVLHLVTNTVGVASSNVGTVAAEAEGRPLIEQLIEHLGGRGSLLIFDNCEHLVAPCAELAVTLLAACPDLKILVTSREPLGAEGEVPWRVPSMSVPGPGRQPIGVAEASLYQAVNLFVQRARISLPDFELTPDNSAAVAEIVRRLDGIPLAIELAAARVKVLSPQQIASMLDDQFRLLTGGSRTALERQQTLRASVDWSFTHLTEPERVLLRRLSVFAGGATLEAAEEVCSGEGIETPDVLDLIAHLVDKSLVEVDSTAGGTRYRLLETIRQYAREKLADSGDSERVRDRHREFFHRFVSRAGEGMKGDERRWLAALDADYGNVRAAIEWTLDASNAEAVTSMLWSLLVYTNFRGTLEEMRKWLNRAVELTEDPRLRGIALATTAFVIAWDKGLDEELAEVAQSAVDELERSGTLESDPGALVLGLHALRLVPDPDRLQIAERGVSLARTLGDDWLLAFALIDLSFFSLLLGRRDPARERLEEALRIGRALGSHWITCGSLTFLAGIARQTGDLAMARAYVEEAIRSWRDLDVPSQLAFSLNSLGYLALAEGNIGEARASIGEALDVSERVGSPGARASYTHSMGEVEEADGNTSAARALFEQSLAIARKIGDSGTVTEALWGLARLGRDEDDVKTAISHLLEILRPARQRSFIGRIARLLTQLLAPYRAREATRILGAHHAFGPGRGMQLQVNDRAEYEATLASLRAALGEEAFQTAWNEGIAMSAESAIDEVLRVAHEVLAEDPA